MKLLDEEALVSDFCHSGDTVVALPRRNLLPRPAPDTTPAPTSADISTAIRAEITRSGPAAVAEAEAAAAAAAAALQQPQLQAAAPNAFAALAAALMGEADQVALEEALGSDGVAAMHAQLAALVRGMAAGEIGAGGGGGDGGPPFDLAALAGLQMVDSEEEQEDEEGGATARQGAAAACRRYVSHRCRCCRCCQRGCFDFDVINAHIFSLILLGLTEEDEEEQEEDVYYDDESEEEEGMEGSSGEEGGGGGPVLPEPEAAGLATLTEMGFSSGLARNALLLNHNSFDRALEWIMEHAEDEAAAAPLSQERLASIYRRRRRQQNAGHRGSSVAVDAEALTQACCCYCCCCCCRRCSFCQTLAHAISSSLPVTQLQDMGFPPVEASAALRMFGNAVEPAANWLLHMLPLRIPDASAERSGSSDAAAWSTAVAVAASEPAAIQRQQQLQQEHQGGSPVLPMLGSDGRSAAGRGSGSSGQEGSDGASREAWSEEFHSGAPAAVEQAQDESSEYGAAHSKTTGEDEQERQPASPEGSGST